MNILKLTGGKSRLLESLSEHYPKNENFKYYIEPFAGAGWSFFNAIENLKERVSIFVLGDINKDFVNAYKFLKGDEWKFIDEATRELKEKYLSLEMDEKSEMYYSMRDRYNSENTGDLERVIALFFLNASGYNGLYRKNSKGLYNVSFGKRKEIPVVRDWKRMHEVLNSVDIQFHTGSFSGLKPTDYDNALWYFDPPYHNTHTAYSKEGFGESDQIELREFCDIIDNIGSKFMLSNSCTDFILDLYAPYNQYEIETKRTVRPMLEKHECTELLVTNFDHP